MGPSGFVVVKFMIALVITVVFCSWLNPIVNDPLTTAIVGLLINLFCWMVMAALIDKKPIEPKIPEVVTKIKHGARCLGYLCTCKGNPDA